MTLTALLIDTLRLGSADDPDIAARWRGQDTQGLPELVAHEGAAIWLFRRLRALGALDALPSEIGDRLRKQAFEAAALRMEVEVEAAEVVTILNRAKVPVILIKGVARCALADRYPYFDARATQDVDLLLPSDQVSRADAVLRAEHYVPALPEKPDPSQRHHHLPPLHRGRITVELHDSTSVRVPSDVAWARANNGSEFRQWAGQTVQLPSTTELAWSAVAHAMEDDTAGFRLNRFLELAALVSNDAEIDWTVFDKRRKTNELFKLDAGVTDQQVVVDLWMNAALALVADGKGPKRLSVPRLNLEELLAWRLGVLRRRTRVGSAFAGRLLEEGVRTLIGLPQEGSPSGASRWGRIRRSVAGRVGRVAFSTWRATHRDHH